jgi:oligopeptide transport system substrate-binding protein
MAMQNFKPFALAIALGVIMVGCTKDREANQKNLRIHLPIVNLILDPQKMEDAYSMAISSQIHRGLFRYNTAGEVLNDLAESWTESPDHRTYQIKLRAATFSDGSPITPVHVQMSFARMFALGASMAGDIDYIAGSAEFKKTHDLTKLGVRPAGPNTVEFHLSKPSAIFLKQLAVADCAVMKLSDFQHNPDLTARGAYSGPFKVSTDLKNGEVTIQKWRADVLDSSAPPTQITYFMTDKSPIDLALAGETDTLDHDRVEASDKQRIAAQGWASAPTELSGEIFVVLNPTTIPEDVRRLMYGSISASDLMSAIRSPSYRPAYGLIPFGLPGELSANDVKALAPQTIAPLKNPISVDLDFEQTSDLETKIAEFLKSRWEKLNIKINLHPLPKGDKLKKLFGKKSQAIVGRKGMDYPDGFSVLGYFKGNYDSNYFFVNDPAIDAGLAHALQIFDPIARERQYRELQKQILKKWILIPLLFGSEASGLWSSKVKSVPAHPLGYHMLPMESLEMKR